MIVLIKHTVATITVGAALAFCSFTPSVKGDITVADYRGAGFTGTFGTWTGNTSTSPGFLAVTATISGGGFSSVGPFDLSSFLSNNIQISLRQGVGGTNDGTKNILLQLQDNNNFKAGYVFSMAGLPASTQPFGVVSRQLGNPNYYANGGTAANFNFAAVNQVELLGDFSGSNVLNLQFESVSVVPEPGTAGIVLGASLMLIIVRGLARRRTSSAWV